MNLPFNQQYTKHYIVPLYSHSCISYHWSYEIASKPIGFKQAKIGITNMTTVMGNIINRGFSYITNIKKSWGPKQTWGDTRASTPIMRM